MKTGRKPGFFCGDFLGNTSGENTVRPSDMIVLTVLHAALSACGGGSTSSPSPAAPSAPEPRPQGIADIEITHITANSARLSFSTTPASAASVDIWFDNGTDQTAPILSITTSETIQHELQLSALWSNSPWRVDINTSSDQEVHSFTTTPPSWPDGCRSGPLPLPVDSQGAWSIYTDINGSVLLSETAGCNATDRAVRMAFDLGDGEWVVAAGSDSFPRALDLSPYTHLWVPLRGTEGIAVAFEVKLKDRAGNLAVARVDGGAGVPVWRSWAIDLREFSPQVGNLDMTAISALEFAFSWPASKSGPRSGTVDIGTPTAWNVIEERPEVTSFEQVASNVDAMEEVAADLLSRQEPHGFIPAWFELAPNWHLYANAMALIVFTLEYERLQELGDNMGAREYLDAASRLSDRLVDLQQQSNRGGAWDDSFRLSNGQLTLQPAGSRVLWVGSTAWAGIALIVAHDILPQGGNYADAITAAVQFYAAEQLCRSEAGLPQGSVTEGSEGNISSQLFLSAATQRGLGDSNSSNSLARFIEDHLYDTVQERFLCGVEVDSGSGFDRTSCTLGGSGEILRSEGLACLDVASNWGSAWLMRQNRVEDALKGLAFGRVIFPTRGFTNSSIEGLGDIAGPWTPTVEHGAGQWASVGGPDANHLINEAYTHLCRSGSCQGAADNFSAGIGWNTESTGIAPGAWMYIAWHGGFWSRL
jgi:hypothetical protein